MTAFSYKYYVTVAYNITALASRIEKSSIKTPYISINLNAVILYISFVKPLSADELRELNDLVNLYKTKCDDMYWVTAVSCENISINSSAGITVDEVKLNVGDTVLLKDQTDPSENGMWKICQTEPMERSIPLVEQNQYGILVTTENGSVNAHFTWMCTTVPGEDVKYDITYARYPPTNLCDECYINPQQAAAAYN